MPRFGSISHKDLIRYLRQLSFDGPYSGGKHQFMLKGDLTLRIPNRIKATSAKNYWRDCYDKLE